MASLIIVKFPAPPSAAASAPEAAGIAGEATSALATGAKAMSGDAFSGLASKLARAGLGVLDGFLRGGGISAAAAGVRVLGPAGFVASVAIRSASAFARKWSTTAQRDEGWAAASRAYEKLGLSLTQGVLGSQAVQAAIDAVAESISGLADRFAALTSETDLLGPPMRAWKLVSGVFSGFVDSFRDLGTIVVSKFELSLLTFNRKIAKTLAITMRSRPGASTVSQDPNRSEVVAIISYPGSGTQYVEPQNRVHGSEGTAQPVEDRGAGALLDFVGLLDTIGARKDELARGIDDAGARLLARFGLAPDGGTGAPGDRPPTPAQLAHEAAARAKRDLAEKLRAWSSSLATREIAASIDSALAAGAARLSGFFDLARTSIGKYAKALLATKKSEQELAQGTEALAAGFGAVARQAEQIAESDSRVAKILANIELHVMAIYAIVESAIELAAGIAAAIALDVAEATAHFVASALFATAATLASGRAVGLIGRSSGDARAIAQSRVDRLTGGAGLGGGRPGTLILNVIGDADLERDERWLRQNILEPIASAGRVHPVDEVGGFSLPAIRKPSTSAALAQALRARYTSESAMNGLYGELAALIALGPYGAVAFAGLLIGQYLGRDIEKFGRKVGRGIDRIGRSVRRIF